MKQSPKLAEGSTFPFPYQSPGRLMKLKNRTRAKKNILLLLSFLIIIINGMLDVHAQSVNVR